MKLALDKSTWQKVSFGDAVKKITNKIDPFEYHSDIVVEGGHINKRDFHIRKYENKNELGYLGPAFHMGFKKGQILYVSRNPHLMKVGYPKFDGICSNTTFIMESKNKDVLLNELIPFLMHSDTFVEQSVGNVRGGVNPYVNWGDLASIELLVPPKAEQLELAKLLWSIDDLIEKEILNETKLQTAHQAIFKDELFNCSDELDELFLNLTSKYEVKKLDELITEIQYGISESLSEEPDSGIPILRMNNLQGGSLDLKDLKYFGATNGELEKFILQKGDILFNRTNSYELVGKVSLFNEDEVYSFASYLIRIKTNKELLDPRFLNYYLNTAIGLAKVRKYRTPGVSQSNINAQNLKKIPIPLPSIDFQKDLMDKIELLQQSEQESRTNISYTRQLKKSIINQVF
ncbi:restriction endonuclease subunit S [Pseudoalteromonas sp. PAB 2.2]|uniref:restriction endonuclease subunit S n=1 Tax=Pseudoalteromonas sp. PAB 2.2 TaxID=1841508 RepID=UPI00094FC108|nr:restriction endonuclease subunit S [Pseudoalteromonas sp. PAB 2.2]